MSRSEVAKMCIALPPDLKAWVAREAELDDRSQNSVIIRTIRAARRDQEQRERTEPR